MAVKREPSTRALRERESPAFRPGRRSIGADRHTVAFVRKGQHHFHHLAFELTDRGELRVALDHLLGAAGEEACVERFGRFDTLASPAASYVNRAVLTVDGGAAIVDAGTLAFGPNA